MTSGVIPEHGFWPSLGVVVEMCIRLVVVLEQRGHVYLLSRQDSPGTPEVWPDKGEIVSE